LLLDLEIPGVLNIQRQGGNHLPSGKQEPSERTHDDLALLGFR
jgi:hypothetical protein